jgi:sulfur-oxidizing protein SoxZ
MAKRNIKPRVRVPKQVKKGDVFEVKTLVSHPMETGMRVEKKTGQKIPRDIINKFIATYNGKEVMKAIWHPAMSANPYSAFNVVADKSGPMTFTWIDDNEEAYTKEVMLNVVE